MKNISALKKLWKKRLSPQTSPNLFRIRMGTFQSDRVQSEGVGDNQCGMETTKELPDIARLKIHPDKLEELNPALPPVLLPEQALRKQTCRFTR